MKQLGLLAFAISSLLFFTHCQDDPLTGEEIYSEQITKIDAYIASKGLDRQIDDEYEPLGVGSGMRYVIHETGSDVRPQLHDSIVVAYKLWLLDDPDRLIEESDSLNAKLDEMIAGWQILLPKIFEGGRMTMFIPSFYAYRGVGVGSIPANSALIFEVSLLEVKSLTSQQQLAYDQSRIDAFLDKNNMEASLDSTYLIKYRMIKEGAGDKPTLSSDIVVSYQAYYLDERSLNLVQFDAASFASLKLTDVNIEGWEIMLPKIGQGGQIEMYLPSLYAFGTRRLTLPSVPSNSVIVYDVRLESIQ